MPANVLGTAFEPAGCPPAPGQVIKVSGVHVSQVMVHHLAGPADPVSPLPAA